MVEVVESSKNSKWHIKRLTLRAKEIVEILCQRLGPNNCFVNIFQWLKVNSSFIIKKRYFHEKKCWSCRMREKIFFTKKLNLIPISFSFQILFNTLSALYCCFLSRCSSILKNLFDKIIHTEIFFAVFK